MEMSMALTADIAALFARTALSHVTREYPNKLDHVLAGPEDLRSPRQLHPVFFGSFDWHSCVHGWWTLFTVLRLYPDLAEAELIRDLADIQFTADNVTGELAYLARPEARGFERPYGWAWLLMLAAELGRHNTGHGRTWSSVLTPLAEVFAERFKAFLPQATYPVRAGAHSNTAFALTLALDYADEIGDTALSALCRDKAIVWYGEDRDCQAWEPSQDDFLSPALIEAELMRRVLPDTTFQAWRDDFLPHLADRHPSALFRPAMVGDRTDGKIAHLDGLNLSRAWCWRGLARSFTADDRRHAHTLDAADRHLVSALPYVTGDYMGEHWLASFALLAVLAN
jgi:hypothetical protein